MSGKILRGALEYAARGWLVHPLHSITAEGHCSCSEAYACGSPGKHPRTEHGFHAASNNSGAIRGWWRDWPEANVGIRTGDGLLVVDLDRKDDDGAATWSRLLNEHGAGDSTPVVSTGSGGWHIYYSVTEQIRNTNQRSPRRVGPGIDTRCGGGYVVAPPSGHASGGIYEWATENESRPAVAPEWLVTKLRTPPVSHPTAERRLAPASGGTAYGFAALRAQVAEVSSTPSGGRNDALYLSALKLGSLATGGEIDVAIAVDRLLNAAVGTGLPEHEARTTIRSGTGAGAENPREARPR